MSGIKDKRDDGGDWTIRVQKHKEDLKHNTNDENCWCCPDLVQPCRTCGVQWWSEDQPEEIAEHPDKLPLMEKFRAQANEDCPVCHGRGLEAEYDKESGHLIAHR